MKTDETLPAKAQVGSCILHDRDGPAAPISPQRSTAPSIASTVPCPKGTEDLRLHRPMSKRNRAAFFFFLRTADEDDLGGRMLSDHP